MKTFGEGKLRRPAGAVKPSARRRQRHRPACTQERRRLLQWIVAWCGLSAA